MKVLGKEFRDWSPVWQCIFVILGIIVSIALAVGFLYLLYLLISYIIEVMVIAIFSFLFSQWWFCLILILLIIWAVLETQ